MTKFSTKVALFVFSLACICKCTIANAKVYNIIDIYREPVFELGVMKNMKPVVVFYYSSSTCKSCIWSILPMLEGMIQRKGNSIYLARVDLDKVPMFREQHAITTLPTTMFFYHGDVMDSVEGPYWGQIVKLVNDAIQYKN